MATQRTRLFPEQALTPRQAALEEAQRLSDARGQMHIRRHVKASGHVEVFRCDRGELDGYWLEGKDVPRHVGAVRLREGQQWN